MKPAIYWVDKRGVKKVMRRLPYLENEGKFKDYAFDVFEKYFSKNRDKFEEYYNAISDANRKDLFLKIATLYKFLIKKCRITTENIEDKDDKNFSVEYFDNTLKFVVLFSLIESLMRDEEFMSLHSYIKKKNKFSIDIKEFEIIKEEYFEKYGATRKVKKFFNEYLSEEDRKFIMSKIKLRKENFKEFEYEIGEIVSVLYDIRSKFMHNTDLILEFMKGTNLSKRNKKIVTSHLNMDELCEIFESGFVQFFNDAMQA